MKHGNPLHLVTYLTVIVALVAADDAVVKMERKDSSLQDMLVDDYLLMATKNTNRKVPNQNGKQEPKETITSAPEPLTEHPFHAQQRELLQGEHLLPAQKTMSKWYENEKSNRSIVTKWSGKDGHSKVTLLKEKSAKMSRWDGYKETEHESVTVSPNVVLTPPPPVPLEEMELLEFDDLLPVEDLQELSRDRRAAGSGEFDTEAVFTVTLEEFYSVAAADETARKTAVAGQLRQELLDYEVDVETVTVTTLLVGIDSRAKYNCSITFNSATDRQGVAYALERTWRDSTLIGSYEIYTSPTICNAAGVDLNVICLLCPADRPCTSAGVCQTFDTAASTERTAFGLTEADIKLPHADDVVSSQIDVPNGMPVFGRKVFKLFVGDNGGVSFGTPYNPFFLENMQSSTNNYICIFCGDFDNRNTDTSTLENNVWYQTYASGRPWAPNMLDRLTSEVRQHTEFKTFKASWAIVVTWSNLPEYTSFNVINHKGNSFQMIIVTSGEATFLLFYYIDIKASQPFRENGVHGYKFVGSAEEIYELLYSRKNIRNDVASSGKPKMSGVKGNTGIKGKWIFMIGQSEPDYASQCINWYLQNLPLRNSYRQRASRLGNNRCPCWRNVFQWSAPFLPMAAFNNQAFFCSEFRARFAPWQDSYECCYDALGRFINRYPEAGGYHRYGSFIAPYQHKLQDSDPKDWCCRQTNLCHLYNDVRPASGCRSARPIIIFIFIVGDPHFVTLDGKKFTYNGIGEHRLLELTQPDFTFKVQCRTAQAISSTGEKVRASIFSAFAAELKSDTLGSAMFHVGLNKERTKIVLYINDIDMTLAFRNDANFEYTSDFFNAFKKSDKRIDFSFTKIDITMAIKLESGALAQAIIIPETYKGKTIGLLGNYNDNPEDDFVTPDGTNYLPGSTDKQLLPYGKTWAVPDQASSCLHYAPGETTAGFTDANFIPLYYEDITDAQRNAATVICGSGNEQCIYDYVVTQNADLAKATTELLKEANDNNVILGNRAPTISGTNQMNVEVGKPSTLQFLGSDADGHAITYVAVDSPSAGFTFDQATGSASFTPNGDTPVKIGVAAKDSENTQSSVMEVKIRLCKGCVNGQCNYNSPVTEPTSESDTFFQIVTCTCDLGYTGDDCSVDRNGCENTPCGESTECKDNTPAQEQSGLKPYTCSSCLAGFVQPAVGLKCENVNECTTNNGDCPDNADCEDSIGSYKCTCQAGFRMNSDRTVCEDIEECLEHLTDCAQTCSNVLGSFDCGCHQGYNLAADNKSCVATGVPAACPSTCNTATELCVNNGTGHPSCVCKPGYELKAGGTSCTDIDECTLSLCAQKCVNSVGSFTCSCYSGFKLAADNLDCIPCSFPSYGDDCSETCECQGRASECNPVNGCMCLSPWSGPSCNTDVNECTLNPDICGRYGVCTDTVGSYVCTCQAGYVRHGNECIDDNECESDTNMATCPSNSECINTLGSYTCTCREGYIKSGDTCTDIDECASSKAQCEHKCLNLPGSFNCYCELGYTLNDDRTTCTKDPDKTQPCEGLTNTECAHFCTVENSQPVCKCKRGYSLAADNIACLDVDECSDNFMNLCEVKSTCTNTPGSYTCGCPVGQKLENDGRNCAECDGSTWGLDCASNCSCSHLGTSTCDNVKGCVCITGWTGATCNTDVDECSTETCPANSDCVNQPGTFDCQCRTGYKKSADGSTCQQIDECADSSTNICEHDCVDTAGSYYCTCEAGFILEGMGTCKDIDECAKGSHDCQQECRNTAGSFTCQCLDGFQFTDSNRKTCEAITPQTCNKSCDNVNGGCLNETADTCFCNSGFTLNDDGVTCNDNDECTDNPGLCSGTCSNTPAGSYTCACNDGFSLAADGTTCTACIPNKWGPNCANTCLCKPENTVSCNSVDGTCDCRGGWDGATCETDVKECDNLTICGDNGVCTEQDGGYQCTCEPGYLRTDVCTPCTSEKWGDNCAKTCTCDFTKTVSCNPVNGACTCKPEWTGADCTTDVNECTSTSSPVCTGAHEECANKDGSYSCGCDAGYQRNADNTACIDLNECLVADLNTCTFVCNNNDGGFDCSCPQGYLGSGNNCDANFFASIIIITLDSIADLSIPSSAVYKKLQIDVAAAVDAQLIPIIGISYLPSVVVSVSSGSVIANTELRFDLSKTDNQLGELAKALEKLAEVRSLAVDGSDTTVTNITYKGIPIFKVHTVCEVYKMVRNFSNDEYCELDENGTPVARKLSDEEDQVPLIVGLTIGSLIFLILITLLLIYCCCIRKPVSRAPSEDRDQAFRSAFAGTLPTKGTFGVSRYMMYSPHTLSDAASQASEDSGRRERLAARKLGPYDFADMPRWNNDQSTEYYETRGPETRNDLSSDFSWGNMFNRLGQVEIPRPAVSTAPNKFHDSLA